MKVSFEHAGKKITFVECGGQWRRDVWNARTKKAESFYFGSVIDDPEAKQAMYGPQNGWIVREGAIRAGLDRTKVVEAPAVKALGPAIVDFLKRKQAELEAGELADETFRDYLRELGKLELGMGETAELEAIGPQHFTAYMRDRLQRERHLGPHRIAAAIRYIKAFFNDLVQRGTLKSVAFGPDFVPPATDPETLAARRIRQGESEEEEPIFETPAIDWLLWRSTPLFRAMILLALNCGIGPSDLGRLHWSNLNLEERSLRMRRGKTGRRREAFLWKKTVKALRRVQTLKHCRAAIEAEDDKALVFLTRTGRPMIQRKRIMKGSRVIGIHANSSISITFSRWVAEAKKEGLIPPQAKLTFYNLRHTYYTHAENVGDLNAVNRTMGHALVGMGRRYKRKPMPLPRLKRVALHVYRSIWPPKPKKEKSTETRTAPATQMKLVA